MLAVAERNDKYAGRILTPDADTLAAQRAAAVAATRACLTRYTVQGTAPGHLLALGKAYLAADDLSRADAAFDRLGRLSAHKSVSQRAWDLSLIVAAYADTAPARLAKALKYMEQLDALGSPAAGSRLSARNALYRVSATADSVPLMAQQSQAALKASRELRGDAVREFAWESVAAVKNEADLVVRRGNGAEAVALLKKAVSGMGSLREGIRVDLESSIALTYSLYGKPAVPLQSMFVVMPGQPMSTGSSGRPSAGKVSLLVFVDQNCGDLCYSTYALTQRLMRSYVPKGLEVTLVAATRGIDRDRLISDPAKEAESIAQYFHGALKMPIPLVIWKTTFTADPVDGRLSPSPPNPNSGPYPNLTFALVDRAGTICHVTGFGSPVSELRLRHLIEAALEAKN